MRNRFHWELSPLPVAPPTPPRSPAVTDPVAAWHTEHVYFTRLLRLLRREIDVIHSGGDPGY